MSTKPKYANCLDNAALGAWPACAQNTATEGTIAPRCSATPQNAAVSNSPLVARRQRLPQAVKRVFRKQMVVRSLGVLVAVFVAAVVGAVVACKLFRRALIISQVITFS